MTASARVLVLGALHRADKPMHGYEIRQELERWGAEHWASLSYGSIYHALAKMAEEGLLTEAITESSQRGPDRKLYELTEQGRQEFAAGVRDLWWRYKPAIDRMSTAIAFMDVLPTDELLAALRRRAQGFRLALDQYPEWIRLKLEHAPAFVAESLHLGRAKDEAELAWIEGVIEKIENGELP